ncbi:hypothetical protein HYALB_00006340 [Hymenoscyphus albidus]|uniref:Uncharacterized protein n=1 Tax=Hymenoscyphus albidus TaxID=595503 RepID=A0A9N9LIJ2_9HELO|nr:hypothetical protein HYALB_00006340 [Hymenoscyphus albidus]
MCKGLHALLSQKSTLSRVFSLTPRIPIAKESQEIPPYPPRMILLLGNRVVERAKLGPSQKTSRKIKTQNLNPKAQKIELNTALGQSQEDPSETIFRSGYSIPWRADEVLKEEIKDDIPVDTADRKKPNTRN